MSIPVKAKRFRPESRVSFLTEEGEITANSKHINKQGDVIDSDVVDISTENDLNADAGTFKISLTSNKRWDKVLGANDLVTIEMWRNGYTGDAVILIGLVDDVRKSTTIQGNTPQRVINVIGRNFAKAFINFEVGVVEAVEAPTNRLGWVSGRVTFTGQSSSQVIQQVLEMVVFPYMNYKFNDEETLRDKMGLKLSNRKGEKLVSQMSFVNYQGNIQAFLKELIDEPFNELFWEVYDNKPTLVERETPFNEENWNSLKLHVIEDKDVVLDELGRSDIETYTLFSVSPKYSFLDPKMLRGLAPPLWYEKYFKKFGLRQLSRMTNYVGIIDQEGSKTPVERLKNYQRDLANWNIMNPSFFNGNLTIKGNNEFKIGDRVLYKSKSDGRDIEFYIESVSHEFVNFSYWNTRLSVTRGLPNEGKDRFKAPWGELVPYEGGALGTPSISDLQGSNVGQSYFPPYQFPNYGISNKAAGVIQTAKSLVGKVDYQFGGGRLPWEIENNIFDCSSFIRYVYDVNGIEVGQLGSTTTDTLAQQGVRIPSLSNLRPGDLIFFNTYKHNGHVGIYIGDGKFIGAQSSGCSVEEVNWWIDEYGLGSMRRVIR